MACYTKTTDFFGPSFLNDDAVFQYIQVSSSDNLEVMCSTFVLFYSRCLSSYTNRKVLEKLYPWNVAYMK